MRSMTLCAAAVLITACGGSTGRYVDERASFETASPSARSSLEISRIGTYANSGIHSPRRLFIRGEQEWREFWYDMDLGSPPEIDFNRDMVIAVAGGSRPTTGYSVLVNDVRLEEDGTLRVEILETTPGRGCVTGQQMTNPVDIVVVRRSDLRTWSFTDRRVVQDC